MADPEAAGASDAPRRIGIMGGTFDPIHHGHLICGEEARFQFNLEKVIFLPAGDPWQKQRVSPAADRYEMTLLGAADNEYFSVSRAEIDRPGPTYTNETLDWFRHEFGESAELFFITGADAVARILSWKQPEEVLDKAHFIAARRSGVDLGALADDRFKGRVSLMDIPSLAISSSDIRRRVAEGRPIRYLVPPAVAKFIEEHNLYGAAG